MSVVSLDECKQLAHLARLSLTTEEAEHFSRQLAQILTYIEQLQSVDVSAAAEFQVPPAPDSALRVDEVGPMLSAADALAGVPKKRGKLVVVPKFKED